MQINIVFDADNNGADTPPPAAINVINYVANLYDNLFTNPVTVNLDIGWGEAQHLGNLTAAENGASAYYTNGAGFTGGGNIAGYNWVQIKSALLSSPASDQIAIDAAEHIDPNPDSIEVTRAEAKALGFISDDTNTDGWIGFSNTANFDYSLTDVAPPQGEVDFLGVVEHEFAEEMGRRSEVGTDFIPVIDTNDYTAMDLWRYSAPGVPDLSPGGAGATAYFSIDGGATNLGTWNNVTGSGLDYGDWVNNGGPAPGGNDAFNDQSGGGTLDALSTNDLVLMETLGWDLAFNPTAKIGDGETGYVGSNVPTVIASATAGGGEVSNDLLVMSGGYLEVGAGGVASGTLVSGGTVQVDVGGSAVDTVISYGGVGGKEYVLGLDFNAQVTSGGLQEIKSGGTASGASLSGPPGVDGGTQDIDGGGTAVGTTVAANGIQNVESGAVASVTSVGFDGQENVFSGGTAIQTTVDSSGEMAVEPGAVISSAVINGGGIDNGVVIGGGLLILDGTAVSTMVSGGSAFFSSGAVASGLIVSGGVVNVSAGATVSGLELESAFLEVSSGATLSGAMVDAGGNLTVDTGATFSGALTVNSGGSATIATNLTSPLIVGGTLTVLAGGSAVNATVSSLFGSEGPLGGTLNVYGTDVGATVDAWSTENVFAGGVSSDAIINDAGLEISAGAVASGATISGGTEEVWGSDTSATLIGSATQFVESGGLATDGAFTSSEQIVEFCWVRG